ncbi:hypothetical protein A2363_02740 [Candidatus Gottesmanbacteria bacterium RIFOXYB1_FULL_47_11]|uniref:Uncharacterized protein n=1 Tax=Candidatus Gottesmanbacteria bacterium RIFOXYB1_FULL_47_11 TaxID=1798401 RepID=A0A1F6BED9_9BACT|nr:MAG: hypothetical protein A2363_02740 [Candidatus Gottesmanbacteria bacterium RIFOXYB1_FULL_47_11]
MSLKELQRQHEAEQAAAELKRQRQISSDQTEHAESEALRLKDHKLRMQQQEQAMNEIWSKSGIEEVFREAQELKDGTLTISETHIPSFEETYSGHVSRSLRLEWKVPTGSYLFGLVKEYSQYDVRTHVLPNSIWFNTSNDELDVPQAYDRGIIEKKVFNLIQNAKPIDHSPPKPSSYSNRNPGW